MNFTNNRYEKMMKQVPRPPRSAQIHIKKKQKSGKNFAENELYEENNYPYDE